MGDESEEEGEEAVQELGDGLLSHGGQGERGVLVAVPPASSSFSVAVSNVSEIRPSDRSQTW